MVRGSQALATDPLVLPALRLAEPGGMDTLMQPVSLREGLSREWAGVGALLPPAFVGGTPPFSPRGTLLGRVEGVSCPLLAPAPGHAFFLGHSSRFLLPHHPRTLSPWGTPAAGRDCPA